MSPEPRGLIGQRKTGGRLVAANLLAALPAWLRCVGGAAAAQVLVDVDGVGVHAEVHRVVKVLGLHKGQDLGRPAEVPPGQAAAVVGVRKKGAGKLLFPVIGPKLPGGNTL